MSAITIPLTQGQVALIDEQDAALVGQYTWHAARRDNTFYAASMTLRGKGYYMHRFLMNAPSDQHVDHRNGDGLDNRRENLRLCSNAQNRRNMRVTRGASRFKGVARCKSNPGRPWESYIWFENRKIHLGAYPSEVEAARAYNAAAVLYHGEFAHINEIEGLTYDEAITAPVRNRKLGRPCRRIRH